MAKKRLVVQKSDRKDKEEERKIIKEIKSEK